MSGIWKLCLGTPAEKGLFSLSGSEINSELIEASDCPLPSALIECEQVLDRFVLRIPLDPSERLYGLGLNFDKMTLNMAVRHLRVDHFGGKDNGRTHAPVPFYVSDAGYGVLIDTAENISFYMGGAVRVDAKNPPPEMNRGRDDDWQCNQKAEYVEASFIGTGATVYLFKGNTPRDVVSRFNMLCGGGCLPPKWGLGFWHRVHIRFDEGDVMNELSAFDAHHLPVDVLGLEPGWQSGSYPCTYEWDQERFPDPKAFVQGLLERGTHVNLWENMFISRKSRICQDILPYCASHQVWGGAVPDYTMSEAREILCRQHEQDHPGISGYKVDECDGIDAWLWPDHARFPSGASATAVRNAYGVCLQRMFDAHFRKKDLRTYGLVRATNAGASSLPYCIYNDCYDFKQFLTGLATSSFCGALWVPEVRNADTGEEWVRRFQLSALSPMLMLNAWASGAKPWMFPEVEEIIADTIRLRGALLPYFYNAFYRYKSEGIPPFRALVMDYAGLRSHEDVESGRLDDTKNPYEIREIADVVDQYLVGDCLMAAPMLPGQTERSVLLPPGKWYDFHTGEQIVGRQITYPCPLDRIPLFVKEGGMIPMLQPDGSLEVKCFGASGECTLYDDDGESYRYEQGICAMLHLSFVRDENGLRGNCVTENHGYQTTYTRVTYC